MKKHALFVVFEQAANLLQTIGGALKVNTDKKIRRFKNNVHISQLYPCLPYEIDRYTDCPFNIYGYLELQTIVD